MKAVVIEDNKRIVYKDIPTPEPGAGQVRIKVAVCGICGSDIPRVFNNGAHRYPIVLGHEFSGVIDAVGDGVSALHKGDHAVAAPLVPCGKCTECLRGNYALCSQYSFIGSRQPGGMAEYVVVPAKNVVKIPASIPFEQAATIEPATVAVHALKQAKFGAGKSIAVLGCGIIGLYTIAWAKWMGAASVTAISRGKAGLEVAKRMGANMAVSTAGCAVDEVPKELEGSKFDHVLECSGADGTIHLALRLVANRGCVCLVGTPKKELTFSVPVWEKINRKECWITGSWMSYSEPFPGEEWKMAVSAMEGGTLRFDKGTVAGIYPMFQAAEAFEAIYGGQAKGRVLLRNLITNT